MLVSQERYSSLAPLYYRGASAATVVYDITNAETFKKARALPPHPLAASLQSRAGDVG
jgi:hypothetical protein